MPETIESFVAKLQADGVQAGQDQAEKIKADAQAEADRILEEARQQAEKIKADAQAEADSVLQRSQTDLKLAARDATMKLRDALQRCLQAVLAQSSEQALSDVKFLGQTLHHIISSYAEADIEGDETIRINVPEDTRQKLIDWAIAEIGRERIEHEHGALSIDLKGTLRQAGFEYNVTGATVEVTVDSVVEMLSEMVSPRLREVIDEAMNESTSA